MMRKDGIKGGTYVYKTDPVLLARGEGGLKPLANHSAIVLGKSVGTVDQRVRHRRRARHTRQQRQVISSVVVPVRQRKHAEVDIVVGRGRAVNLDAAEDAVPRLHVEVRVVPRASVLCCAPGVGDRVAGGSGALSDGGHAIILVGVVLADAVEVDGCAVVLHRVLDVHDDSVTPVTVSHSQFASFLFRVNISGHIRNAHAMIVGPGMVPLTANTIFSTPSAASVVLTMSNQYSRVTPVSGTSS